MVKKALKQIEFAKLLGVSRSYVTELKKNGRLVMTQNNLVDVEASQIRIQETADPNRDDVTQRHAAAKGRAETEKKKRERDPNHVTFSDGRAKEQHYKALQAEIDYKKTIGELVPMQDMKMAVTDMVMTFRQQLENLPHQLAPELVGKDHDFIRIVLKQRVHDALSDLERACSEKINQQQVGS